MELSDLAPSIIGNMIPDARFGVDDRDVLRRNSAWLLGLTEDVVTQFYDRAYAHPPTAAVFEDGERPAREESLRAWWVRTVSQEIDERYFEWMAMVGVLHIRRRVKNPMMLSMLGVLISYVADRAAAELAPDVGRELTDSLRRLQNMLGSLISDSYTQAYIASLEGLAGFTPELTERMLELEVRRLSQSQASGTA